MARAGLLVVGSSCLAPCMLSTLGQLAIVARLERGRLNIASSVKVGVYSDRVFQETHPVSLMLSLFACAHLSSKLMLVNGMKFVQVHSGLGVGNV